MLKGKVLEVQGDLFEEFNKGTFNVLLNLMNREGKYNSGISRSIGKLYPDFVDRDARVWPNAVTNSGRDIEAEKKGNSFSHEVSDGKFIVNLYAIKKNRNEDGSLVSLKQLRSALKNLIQEESLYFRNAPSGFKPVYGFPAMGTGIAGGDWEEISDVLSEVLLKDHRGIYIYQ